MLKTSGDDYYGLAVVFPKKQGAEAWRAGFTENKDENTNKKIDFSKLPQDALPLLDWECRYEPILPICFPGPERRNSRCLDARLDARQRIDREVYAACTSPNGEYRRSQPTPVPVFLETIFPAPWKPAKLKQKLLDSGLTPPNFARRC
jgi:hypothetical protein